MGFDDWRLPRIFGVAQSPVKRLIPGRLRRRAGQDSEILRAGQSVMCSFQVFMLNTAQAAMGALFHLPPVCSRRGIFLFKASVLASKSTPVKFSTAINT